jgi:glycerol-3-phosphate dehydrogenase
MRDMLVIGGGINGAGIARDAAGRGLSVTLVEKDDLAQHTSSASTKLVHGGLRYLEQYEFRLVRESLAEREVLLANAPHIVWPLRFVLPHHHGLRPRWMLRLGLFLYDHIGGRRTLPGSGAVMLDDGVLRPRFRHGFEYSDCWVDDARLVVLNAVAARQHGGEVLTRTAVTGLARHDDHWIATLSDGGTIKARTVVNAAGPWVDDVAALATLGRAKPRVRLVKGSHIVVPRKHAGEHAYLFQQADGRVVFALPYEREFTLIGTTDVPFNGDRDRVEISPEEVAYLCAAASEYFREPVLERDVVSTYAGVRPLYDDHSASNSTVTRDYVFELDVDGGAPLLSVYGGKITTYRKLAEHALERLAPHLPMGQAWTRAAPLPGGDLGASFRHFAIGLRVERPWLPAPMAWRLARAYGTRANTVLGPATSLAGLGQHFGGDLYEAELRYLRAAEFARSAEDVLWRRSKLALHLPAATAGAIEAWFAAT